MATLWLDLKIKDARVVVNMNTVTHMNTNNPSDEASGTVLYFGFATEFGQGYIVVDETLKEIHHRLSKVLL